MAPARRATGDGIARWLLPAAVLHAVLVVLGAALARGPGPTLEHAAPAPRAPDSDASSELSLLDDAAAPVAAHPPARQIPLRAERAAGGRTRADAARSPPLQTATASSLDAGGRGAPSLPGPDQAPAPSTANESAREPSSSLSLAQLGVGTNPFLDVAVAPLTREEQARARLYAALHPPTAERQRGPAGPVADAARGLLLADDVLAETNAVFNVSVDGSGHVNEVHVLDASSQVKAWQMLAARLAKALEPVKLPSDSRQGWAMKLRLASTVQLPSGAAPGMRVSALGQQLAGSGGPGSTSLELSPTSKLDLKDPIDNIARHMEPTVILEVMLLVLRADPADIGATARRVVQVDVLSLDPSAAP
jgi:hypothetical protein